MRYSLPIVGARFRPPSEAILRLLPLGFPLTLRREPSNKFDVNAIMVLIADEAAFNALPSEALANALEPFGKEPSDIVLPWHLGYIPREDAEGLAKIVDERLLSAWNARLGFAANGQPRAQFILNEED